MTRTYFTENVRPDPSHPLLLLLLRLQSRSVLLTKRLEKVHSFSYVLLSILTCKDDLKTYEI